MGAVQLLRSEDIEGVVLSAPGPIALDFYQASCPPSMVLAPRLERVAREYAGLPVYRVDLDQDLSVAQRFGVMSLPTVLIVRNGQEVDRA